MKVVETKIHRVNGQPRFTFKADGLVSPVDYHEDGGEKMENGIWLRSLLPDLLPSAFSS